MAHIWHVLFGTHLAFRSSLIEKTIAPVGFGVQHRNFKDFLWLPYYSAYSIEMHCGRKVWYSYQCDHLRFIHFSKFSKKPFWICYSCIDKIRSFISEPGKILKRHSHYAIVAIKNKEDAQKLQLLKMQKATSDAIKEHVSIEVDKPHPEKNCRVCFAENFQK